MSLIGSRCNLRFMTAVIAAIILPLAGCSSNSSDSSNSGEKNSAPLFGELPSSIQQAGTISVGSSIDYPPFESYAADGKTLQGFEPELAAELEKQLGVKFQWNNANFDTLFSALRGNRYGIVYGAVNDTAEREKTFDFVDYLQSSQAFVAGKGNPQNIKTVDDLCGKAIAAVRGGVQEQFLRNQSTTCTDQGKGPIDVLTFDGNSGEQLAVKQGRAAALLENYPTAVAFAKDSNGEMELVPNLKVATSYYGMVVNKRDTQLRDALQKAWQAIMDDGSYQKVLEKWGLADIAIKKATINAAGSGQPAS
jgi:polar amino acid transport system substrate-binding protein